MKRRIGLTVTIALWAMLLPCGVLAAAQAPAFHLGDPVYVAEPGMDVRSEASARASVLAVLPIGMQMQFQGGWSSHSPYCSERGADANAETAGWACIATFALPGENDLPFYGWVAVSALAKEEPQLNALLARYDSTPKDDAAARRKWAERALALDPASGEAEQRLIAALTALGDQPAIAAAEKSFAAWQAHQPAVAPGESPAIYAYDGYSISRFAGIVNGDITRGDIGSAIRRGQFYYVYSGGRKVGTVATIMQFNCAPRDCPAKVPVAAMDTTRLLSNLPGNLPAYATNFPLFEKTRPAPAITARQKAVLTAMMKNAIRSVRSRESREALLAALNSSRSWASTAHLGKDGRLALVGQIIVGGTSSETAGAEPLLASVLVIAEQQKGDRYRRAAIVPPALGDCYASDAADFDGDGTDEIVLTCRPTGVYYNYGLLKRVKGKWVRKF